MAVELASAYVSVVPSFKGVEQKLKSEFGDPVERESEGAGNRSGEKFKGAFGGHLKAMAAAAGAAFAAIGVAQFGKDAIGAASDLAESQNKVNVVFGESSPLITKFAESAATSLGQSKQQALEAAGTFGNLFRAMGIGTPAAADMSTKLIGLAGDLSSFNNANPEDVLIALKAGLVGETEPLRAFGVNLNDARIKAEALRLGLVQSTVDTGKLSAAQEAAEKAARKVAEATQKYGADSVQARDATRDAEQANAKLAEVMEGKVPDSLDAAQKAQAAYSLIMKDTSLAQGDFARTSDGLANKQRILSARFQDLKAKIGAGLLPVVLTVAGFIGDKVIPVIEQLSDKVRVGISALKAAFSGEGITSDGFVGVMERIGVAARGVVDFFVRNWPNIKAVLVPVLDAAKAALEGLAAGLQATIGFLNDHREILVGVAVAIGTLLVAAFVSWAASAAAAAVATIAAMLPIIAIGAAIAALVAGIIWAYQNWGWFHDAVDAVWHFLQDKLWPILQTIAEVVGVVVVAAVKVLITYYGFLWDVLSTIVNFIRSYVIPVFAAVAGFITGTVVPAVAGLVTGISNFVSDARGKFDEVVNFIWGLPGRIASAAVGMFDGIKNAFRSAINFIIGGWNGLQFTMPSFDTHIPGVGKVGGFTIGLPDIPYLAAGGIVTSPTLAMLAEAGRPEAVIPLDRAGAGGVGATFNQNFYAQNVDGTYVAREVAWVLKTAGL